jgi:hypothetical protein
VLIMAQALQNSDMNLRRAARHRANHKVIAESRRHGDQYIHIVNISAQGFMIDNNPGYERGERVELRLPIFKCCWTKLGREPIYITP